MQQFGSNMDEAILWAVSGKFQDFLNKMLFLALIFSPDVFLGLNFS